MTITVGPTRGPEVEAQAVAQKQHRPVAPNGSGAGLRSRVGLRTDRPWRRVLRDALAVRDLEEVLPVLADPPLLERVLDNVVGNAARHTPPGSKLLVTASALAGRVELRVVDRGPGLPDGDRDRLFEPFQRLGDNDSTTGLGLGLALSRGPAEAMDGTLTPEDTPGGGLTMVLSLPCAEQAEHPRDTQTVGGSA